MPVCSISVVPVGTSTTSVSSYVASCQSLLEKRGDINFQLTPMATILEGELSDLFDIVKELHQLPFESGVKRVLTTVIIDDRLDKELTMDGKLDSVEEKLKD